jgi:probable F420-dependent oxidoreductase
VAKQAASLDVLSGGRLRLGIGIGWNEVEYRALGENFHNRGKRIEEQVEVLNKLWTQPLVTMTGTWHNLPDAGINPLPVQQPIPIWFGGHAEAVMRRVAYQGAGWMPNYRTAADAQVTLELLDRYLEEAGRRRSTIGLEPRVNYGDGHPEGWQTVMAGWQAVGATHFTINTMGCGFTTPDQHVAALRRFSELMF